MPHLDAETARQIKQSDLTYGAPFRKNSSWFLMVVEALLLVYALVTGLASAGHVVLYVLLLLAAAGDLWVTSRCAKAPKRCADAYARWSVGYYGLLMAWAVVMNLLETMEGRPFVTFVTILFIGVTGIRMAPQVGIPALLVCFAANDAVMLWQRGFDVPEQFNYLCLVFVTLYVSHHVHFNRLVVTQSHMAERTKAAQLEEANRRLSELNAELEQTAVTDPLTKVGNRQKASQVMQAMWNKGQVFSIAYIDVDNLKYCNDTLGHTAGDCYLTHVCTFLHDLCGEQETLYRIGGDEFLLVCPGETEEALSQRLEEARTHMLHMPGVSFQHSFSYGCVCMDPASGESYSALFSRSDQRMYRYKMQHTSRWEFQNAAGPKEGGQIDKSGLDSRVFEVLSITSSRRYLYLTNLQTNIARWSRNAIADFDLPGEYMYDAGNLWMRLIHPDDREMYAKDISEVLSGRRRRHSMLYRVMNREGHYVRCSCEGYVLKGSDNEPDYFAGTITNHGKIDNIDPVTNLYNTYEFLNNLRIYYDERRCVGLLCIGIEQFQTVNNVMGYTCGNQALEQLAQKLLQLVHGKGYAYRLDGVKFAVSIEEASEAELRLIFEQISDIAKNEIRVGKINLSLAVSGCALRFAQVDQNVSMILSELYYALGRAKRDRSGELVYYDDSLHTEAQEHIVLLDEVKRCVLDGCKGFYMVYQPQMDADRHMAGAEALLRWRDEQGQEVSPGAFIPVLENDSCFYDLGSWILDTVLAETRPLVRKHPHLKISVNISYQQLNHRDFRNDVLEALKRRDFPPENLVLELTEHCSTLSLEVLKENLTFFRNANIGIAADDFGTGYSTLSNLRDLPFTSLKVDQGFVRHLSDSEKDQALVEAIITCAKKFHIATCVEGVETQSLLTLLLPYGADYYQGYLFSKPVSLEELSAML